MGTPSKTVIGRDGMRWPAVQCGSFTAVLVGDIDDSIRYPDNRQSSRSSDSSLDIGEREYYPAFPPRPGKDA